MKTIRILFLSVLFILLLIPAVTMNTTPQAISDINNARLADWNTETFNPRDIDAYVKDRIGFYNEAIESYIRLNDTLFGVMAHPSYHYGRDGYTFMSIIEEEVDEPFIDLFCRYLRHVQDTCEARGIPFIYCVNPSKNTVYREYLPAGYRYENRFLQTLYEKLDNYGVNYISNVELLSELAETEQVYNVKYDAGHWNERGQFHGTNHLLAKAGEYFPQVRPWDPSDFVIGDRTQPYLPLSNFRIDETVPSYRYKEEVIETTDVYDFVEVDPQHRHFATYARADGGETLPTALFFHGSYYNKSAEFYKGAFREIYTVHNYQNLLRFKYYLDIFEPDMLLLETAEYATRSSYFDMEEMQRQIQE